MPKPRKPQAKRPKRPTTSFELPFALVTDNSRNWWRTKDGASKAAASMLNRPHGIMSDEYFVVKIVRVVRRKAPQPRPIEILDVK